MGHCGGWVIVSARMARVRDRRVLGDAVGDSAIGTGIAVERFCSKELPSVGKATKGNRSKKQKIRTVSLQPQ